MQFTATPSTVVSLATAEGAKMPLIPHIPELIFGLVMIGILYWVVSTKVVPNLEKAYEERRAAIEGGMEQAEEAQAQAQAALQQYEAQLHEARTEANAIREEARAEGASIVTEMREKAQAEASRITESAKRQIEAERQQAVGPAPLRGRRPVHDARQPHRRRVARGRGPPEGHDRPLPRRARERRGPPGEGRCGRACHDRRPAVRAARTGSARPRPRTAPQDGTPDAWLVARRHGWRPRRPSTRPSTASTGPRSRRSSSRSPRRSTATSACAARSPTPPGRGRPSGPWPTGIFGGKVSEAADIPHRRGRRAALGRGGRPQRHPRGPRRPRPARQRREGRSHRRRRGPAVPVRARSSRATPRLRDTLSQPQHRRAGQGRRRPHPARGQGRARDRPARGAGRARVPRSSPRPGARGLPQARGRRVVTSSPRS